jgi:hypothetical protein
MGRADELMDTDRFPLILGPILQSGGVLTGELGLCLDDHVGVVHRSFMEVVDLLTREPDLIGFFASEKLLQVFKGPLIDGIQLLGLRFRLVGVTVWVPTKDQH